MTAKIQLSREQRAVIDHRGGHLQVIACAGSGKTESISQRVAALLAEGTPPESIVAFTFTERAAAELKERILDRAAERLGEPAKGRLSRLFVGTIHAYCFKLLQDHVPSYGNYEVLDEHRHVGLISREASRLKLDRLGRDGHWEPIRAFLSTVDVIGNELIRPEQLDANALGTVYRDYLSTLDRYHCLTFSLIIQKAIDALSDPKVFESVHGPLRHLFVDEYQDVNPAQEALIRRLGSSPVEVCVVGDDDQAIYQWRGSDVGNIQRFTTTFRGAATLPLHTNRRSSQEIVNLANHFSSTILGRLPKSMTPQRPSQPQCVVPWSSETPQDECDRIAQAIVRLRARGFRFRDIAVLFRSVRTSAEVIIEAFRQHQIPFACGGRTGLFLQPEVEVLGRTYVWLAEWEWRPPGFGLPPIHDNAQSLAALFSARFPGARPARELLRLLEDWKALVPDNRRSVNLIRDYYELLHELGVDRLDPEDPIASARLGALARFSNLLADFENVTRRGRFVDQEDQTREFTGGTDRGVHYYQRLANYLLHYARDAYEDFEGEAAPDLDAVDILTVHQAKGLEWPVVFLPSLSDLRFPSKNTGKARDWILPASVVPANVRHRYEGTEHDERRLFYVAITRARDALYLSHFRRQKNRSRKSRFLAELYDSDDPLPDLAALPLPDDPPPARPDDVPKLAVSFSDLSAFDDCGYRFRLATSLGFETQLVPELGYGHAIHHVLRHVAEKARASGSIPTEVDLEAMLDREFYLPFANKTNFPNLRTMAARLILRYVTRYQDDLRRIWSTERSFELHLPEGTLSGRADVILDREQGVPDRLAIVDYKTTKGHDRDALFAFQLAVYAAAGRTEGLDVRAAYLHHLEESERSAVLVDGATTTAAVERVNGLVRELRQARFVPKPEAKKCKACEYRRLCRHAPADPWDHG